MVPLLGRTVTPDELENGTGMRSNIVTEVKDNMRD